MIRHESSGAQAPISPEIVSVLSVLTQEAVAGFQEGHPNGSLYEIAQAKGARPSSDARAELTPQEVFDAVVPARTSAPARWELVADATTKAKEAAKNNAARIMAAVHAVGMVRTGEGEDYSRISPQDMVTVVQDGANKTSIVRRDVAAQAQRAVGARGLMYQFGSGARIIAPRRQDESPNPEHTLLRNLAGDYLPQGPFTAFDANLATALAEGYEIKTIVDTDPAHMEGLSDSARFVAPISPAFSRALRLEHPESPQQFPGVMLVEPTNPTFEGGLDAVQALEAAQQRQLEGKQIVVATNGQYRPMAALQAQEWAQHRRIDMKAPVAVGDEPGDITRYNGEEFVTADRPPIGYANELALLGRRAAAHVVARGDGTGTYPGGVPITHKDGAVHVHEVDGSYWLQQSGNTVYDGPRDLMGTSIE